MWCVFCFHPGSQQNIIMCKVQIAMDDTTRVHIIQGRSHLTAPRCVENKVGKSRSPCCPGRPRQVRGFSWRFPPKIVPLQLLTFRTDFWTNFGPLANILRTQNFLGGKKFAGVTTTPTVMTKIAPGLGAHLQGCFLNPQVWKHLIGI